MKALVIAAYRPSGALLDLIASLPKDEFAAVVVVDDGSGPKCADIFAQLRQRGVTVTPHAAHIGRGAALRAGMHAALAETPALDSIVLAEEFHTARDIGRVAAKRDALALGTRGRARCDQTAAARAVAGGSG